MRAHAALVGLAFHARFPQQAAPPPCRESPVCGPEAARDYLRRLTAALMALAQSHPPQAQAVACLCLGEGKGRRHSGEAVRELAELWGVDVTTVRSWLKEGWELLAQRLEAPTREGGQA